MIALGADHGGYNLKEAIIEYLKEKNVEYTDYGCYSEESVDYAVYAKQVADAVVSGKAEKGILCCGTGIGISIAANKVKGIRAAVVTKWIHHLMEEEQMERFGNLRMIFMI